MRRALGAVLLCLAVACSESFLPASAVTNLRVIGARIDVQGSPGRANPSPGDDVQASILVIDRGASEPEPGQEEPPLTPPELTWFFFACVPTATRIGVPICGAFEACDGCIGPPPNDPLAFPVIRFQVPPEEELDAFEAREVLLQGVVCGEGVPPSADAILEFLSGVSDDLAPCEDANGEPIVYDDERIVGRFVTVQIPIERDAEDPNLNPEILDVLLDGSDWPPPYEEFVPRAAPRTGCKDALDALSEEDRAKHPVAGSGASSIDLIATGESLQSFTIDGEGFTEELQVSWLADGGGFEVAFSFITQRPASIQTQWQPFSEVPADGRLVRFDFVVRDGRGGLDRVERGLCLLPPAPAESPP